MNTKIKITAIIGALAVGIGAFGAHGLKPYMDVFQIETFKTASMYHFIHAMAMLVISILGRKDDKVLKQSYYSFLAGILCFSGSLYVISTKHLYGGDVWNFVGPITPIGGIFFIFGWANLIRYKPEN